MRALLLAVLLGACTQGHGPIAEDIAGPLGSVVPYASAEQVAAFERGEQVALRRFSLGDGLGPSFNVTFCGACHERPTLGGGAGLYRNFFIGAERAADGVQVPTQVGGTSSGVVRLYHYGGEYDARPAVAPEANVFGQRNPIAFYGIGLLAELPEDEILRRADPEDDDGDGISGRPNYDRGFVGRFGMKAQTVSIEGFIRGPLFNHLGVTTDPLTEAQKAALPVDSSGGSVTAKRRIGALLARHAQVAAPAGPLTDDDPADDPELSTDDLFDLVSMSMLMAAPRFEAETEVTARGREGFDDVGCGDCHTPRLEGPRGPIPAYSDLLLHDLGEALGDGLIMGEATGTEFRTKPLWGLAAVGPYLHDGRATTVDAAIRWHGGEGQGSADAYAALSEVEREELIAFLMSLGGGSQVSPGLIAPGEAEPAPGTYGGPLPGLSASEAERFTQGRALFDREFGIADGVGNPRFNGDSCRACHFEPVVGGAGPRGVNVMRHGIRNGSGAFTEPVVGTVLHRSTALTDGSTRPQRDATIFEHRQTPHLFGLGLIEGIPDAAILAGADPDDSGTPDGISGRASAVDSGRLGRFGWKAQVPTLAEFVRDAVTTELGMTLPYVDGASYGRIHDNDPIADPEFSLAQASLLEDYLQLLAPPPRTPPSDAEAAARGEVLFGAVGCDLCHTPSLPGADGPVPLYSDLLLHEILPPGTPGIEEFSAGERELRTPPLWGIARTAPYLHSGAADTLEQALVAHDGEAAAVRDAFEALPAGDRAALIAFLETL